MADTNIQSAGTPNRVVSPSDAENEVQEGEEDQSSSALKYPQYLGALSASLLGSFAFGTTIGWNSPASVMIEESLNLKPTDVAMIGSTMALGAAAAMLPIPVLLNRFGRKRIMLLVAIPHVVGWLILAFVDTLPLYCLGRFITGFCGGSYCVAVPIFIAEISRSDLRGSLGTFFELFLVTGVCFSFTVGSFTDIKILSLSCMGATILFMVCFIFIPETPFYYMSQGKRKEAEKSLHWYRGEKYDIEDEMRDIEQFILMTQKKVSIRKRFTHPAARRSLVIGCGVIFAQQLSGIPPITYNALEIFRQSNTDITPEYAQMAVGFVQLVVTFFAIFVIERAGRKILLVVSLAGMGLCLTVLGIYYTFHDRDAESTKRFEWVPVTMLCLDIGVFSIGLGPIAWLLVGEVFPSKIKSIACSICSFLSCALSALVLLVFPFMNEFIGRNFTMWIFALINFLFILFVVFVCIETKGKSLRQIQSELSGIKR